MFKKYKQIVEEKPEMFSKVFLFKTELLEDHPLIQKSNQLVYKL